MKILIDIPQDHKRVIDNLVSDGKCYLLPQEVETRLAKAVKIGTVIHNNCEMCERYDKTGKTECNGCNFKLACIPLILIKQAREEITELSCISLSTNQSTDYSDYVKLEDVINIFDKLLAESEG